MYALEQTSAPGVEPVTTAEAKTQLRYDADNLDSYIDGLITLAREKVETDTDRQLITATWKLYLDRFPRKNGVIDVPRPPLQSIGAIEYVDTNGDSQTLAAANYRVDARREPGRITPAFEEDWPSTRKVTNAVTVTFDAGYGDAASDVPARAKHAVKLLVDHWFWNRGLMGTVGSEIQFSYRALIRAFKYTIKHA